MDRAEIVSAIKKISPDLAVLAASQDYPDEAALEVAPGSFKDACVALHKIFSSPVAMLFAVDERASSGRFVINAVFVSLKNSLWVRVTTGIAAEDPRFDSLAKDIYSASLFEREIWEMFGIKPEGNPDLRRLSLHDEVWPRGNYPLRKDFKAVQAGDLGEYKFARVEGEGIFEVPVGPVHAGIIGPGHFRFSAAGEPIINLEIRLGFTHRGVEKLFEGKSCLDAVGIAERVSGDSSLAHSLSFSRSIEKICASPVPEQAEYLRGIYLELERMYNHVNDIGGIAVDVGFSFPAALASIIKEAVLQLNEKLTLSRYLKGVNTPGGVLRGIDNEKKEAILEALHRIKPDFAELMKILESSVSFMDRVDSTGVLKRKTAEDLGITGPAGRASGIPNDLRKYFPGVYQEAKIKPAIQEAGDVLARLRVRIAEFEESMRLIEVFLNKVTPGKSINVPAGLKKGYALGYTEGWRGPVLYWVKIDASGLIERCKIVDPSFHNWQGLSYSVLGDIIPDFPMCNKSFDLSYPGNDL
ncbi:MAG: NADH-quinone oxidoreductase subunit C [Candidatus Omnitrophica bacterium]|nr:NADH-quinone oxidoreductase subunit C [Candidatus Omnitrophota bacterium]